MRNVQSVDDNPLKLSAERWHSFFEKLILVLFILLRIYGHETDLEMCSIHMNHV